MRSKTFSRCLRRSLISANGRLFALNGALKRCRYSAKITAALPLVAEKNSGATASEKVAALCPALCGTVFQLLGLFLILTEKLFFGKFS